MDELREYEVVLSSEADGGFSVFVPELPSVATQGDTCEEAQVGVEPDGAGYVHCPLPDHDERTASCRLYADHWWCFGCERGGGVYDLASLLEGGPWGSELRGAGFGRVREQVLAAGRAALAS